MDDKSPIPVPPAQRWREFRIQLLPFVIFIALAIAIVILWRQIVVPVNLVGEVATVQYQLRTPLDGTLKDLRVEPFTYVHKGEEIGTITVMDPLNLQATLALTTANMELENLRTGMNVNRNLLELSTLQLQQLQVSKDLELNKSDLAIISGEYERAKVTFAKKLIAQETFDVAKSKFEKAQITVDQLKLQLEGYETQLKRFKEGQQNIDMRVQADAIDKALAAATNQVLVANRPQPLIAPADGIITQVSIRPGERVRAGDSIAVITSTNSPYIIGYLRQPLGYIPNINDEVQVRTRGNRRVAAPARVLRVGAQVDYMNPSIVTSDNTRKEKALAVMISIPAGLSLHPGEFVDLWLKRP